MVPLQLKGCVGKCLRGHWESPLSLLIGGHPSPSLLETTPLPCDWRTPFSSDWRLYMLQDLIPDAIIAHTCNKEHSGSWAVGLLLINTSRCCFLLHGSLLNYSSSLPVCLSPSSGTKGLSIAALYPIMNLCSDGACTCVRSGGGQGGGQFMGWPPPQSAMSEQPLLWG